MQVDVIASVNEARAIDLTHRTVIVIDVLRATSTIVTALSHGASGVIPVETVSQAKQTVQTGDVLGGERYSKKITGFDTGNSPFEYMVNDYNGKRIVLTTSNGTRAIQKAMKADHVLAGAMINAAACANAAYKLRKDIALLCAGTQDTFAFEDGLCAGLILAELYRCGENVQEIVTNDYGSMMYSAYRFHENNMVQALMSSSGGKRLSKLGYAKDVDYCAQVNVNPLVPILENNIMKPFNL
ncbi:2-phosphosulfolactate phosphatase [Paenibacillus profundus]|uniref:Probable 2-phosphosulfolactate phosphatase n=1 Tax=Paenibacillus profundus TaxID=1173085 RepID=A0ABS8YN18_9BACL|nr:MULTISPECIES: 2-phosphosulfolactate phosphatase [Paenibacillus]MCE5173201.1 2-phosphosulfolactate phosphatase [Paenibacillus profundus]MCM3340249.1 2-phosphosulfolactate phosphatase [Paenibacillus sp. MER TA 81-3]